MSKAERQRKYQRSVKGKATARKYNATAKGKATAAAKRRAYRFAHPLRWQAKEAVHRALRRGKLVRPASCEGCGASGKLHGHHHKGYAVRYRLVVVWLCGRCHREAHVARKVRRG